MRAAFCMVVWLQVAVATEDNSPYCTGATGLGFGVGSEQKKHAIEEASCDSNATVLSSQQWDSSQSFSCGSGGQKRWFPTPPACFVDECKIHRFRFPDDCSGTECFVSASWYFARNVFHLHAEFALPRGETWTGIAWRGNYDPSNNSFTEWTHYKSPESRDRRHEITRFYDGDTVSQFWELPTDNRLVLSVQRKVAPESSATQAADQMFRVGKCFELVLPVVQSFPLPVSFLQLGTATVAVKRICLDECPRPIQAPTCMPLSTSRSTISSNSRAAIEDASCAFDSSGSAPWPSRYEFNCAAGGRRKWFPVPPACFVSCCPIESVRFPSDCSESTGNCIVSAQWYVARQVVHLHVDMHMPKAGSWNGVAFAANSSEPNPSRARWVMWAVHSGYGNSHTASGVPGGNGLVDIRQSADEKRLTFTFAYLLRDQPQLQSMDPIFRPGECFGLIMPLVESFEGTHIREGPNISNDSVYTQRICLNACPT